jgi:SPP1 gp7 family putative phage head morphogenesis protein
MVVNEVLLRATISHAIGLEAVKGHAARMLADLLGEMGADLVRKLTRRPGNLPMTSLLDIVQQITARWPGRVDSALMGVLREATEHEAEYWHAAITRAIPIELSVVVPAPQQLWAAAVAQPFDGVVLASHAQRFTGTIRSALDSAVRQGFSEGETIQQIVQRIRGTKAAHYTNGIIAEIGSREAKALARTSVAHVAAVARNRTFAENRDIIKEVQFVATLDARTTVLCASLDGKTFPVDEAPQLPLHWGCRSVLAPLVKSWEELGLDKSEIGAATRASMDGSVPASLTYEKWLGEQSEATQREVLGASRYTLWKGGTPLEGFVSDGMRTLTVAELRAREGV